MLLEPVHKEWHHGRPLEYLVLRQAISVERMDSLHYNQVAGKEIRFYFKEGQMDLTRVTGNVMLN